MLRKPWVVHKNIENKYFMFHCDITSEDCIFFKLIELAKEWIIDFVFSKFDLLDLQRCSQQRIIYHCINAAALEFIIKHEYKVNINKSFN